MSEVVHDPMVERVENQLKLIRGLRRRVGEVEDALIELLRDQDQGAREKARRVLGWTAQKHLRPVNGHVGRPRTDRVSRAGR